MQLCIFDLDGTLSNTLRSLTHYCSTALRHCGFPVIDDPKQIQYMVGSGVKILLQRLITASLGSYTQEQYDLLYETYGKLYAEDPMYLVEEYPGVRNTLQALADAGVTLAVLSNKPDAMTKAVVANLYPEIPFALCRGQVEGFPKKPAPDGALYLAEQLGADPKETFYIGDSDVDVKTGLAAQMKMIGVLWGFRTKEELTAAGCTCFVEEPAELLDLIHP